MSALIIICLTASFIAVRSIVLTGHTIHEIKVIRTGFISSITIFRKITGIDRISAWRSCNFQLKNRREKKVNSPTFPNVFLGTKSTKINHKSKSNTFQTWQFSQHAPWAHADPRVNVHVAALQHLFVHSCMKQMKEKTVINYLNKRYKSSTPPEHFHSQRHEAEV